MKLVLITERLSLREFDTNDADFILQLLNTAGWLRFIGDRKVKTLADAVHYIKHTFTTAYQINGFGFWMVQLIDTNEPIGMCGITKRDGLDGIDIGFALLPEYTGKGYAFEIASATLNFVLATYKLPYILAITNPDNIRSIQLLEKIGLTFQQKIKLIEDGEALNLYRVDNKMI